MGRIVVRRIAVKRIAVGRSAPTNKALKRNALKSVSYACAASLVALWMGPGVMAVPASAAAPWRASADGAAFGAQPSGASQSVDLAIFPCPVPGPDGKGSKAIATLGEFRSSDGRDRDDTTRVEVCYDATALRVRVDARGDRFATNSYRGCNASHWKQTVFEVFVALGDERPAAYYEIEVSPAGELFVARIHNPTGRAIASTDLIDCAASGVTARDVASVAAEQRWSASLSIPWTLLRGPGAGALIQAGPPRTLRANFYRIRRGSGDADCGAAKEPCTYLAWRPTFVSPPAFHMTPYFGRIELLP